MPLESEVRRPTRFQELAIAASAKLDEILDAEGRKQPTVVFGKENWDDSYQAPRISWMHVGGSFTLAKNVADTGETDTEPVRSKLGFRVARTRIVLWHVTPEHVEHMLERLWMATERIPGGEAFRWQTAVYEYPSEQQGPSVQSGLSVIVLSLPVELSVPGEFDGETVLVTVSGNELRAGIENPIGEDPDDEDAEYDVDRWTG